MLTLNVAYEVLPDRLVTIKLPETIRPGYHELIIVLQENNTETNAEMLMQFAGSVTAFHKVNAIQYQQAARAEWN